MVNVIVISPDSQHPCTWPVQSLHDADVDTIIWKHAAMTSNPKASYCSSPLHVSH